MTDTSTAEVRHAVRNARDELCLTQNELAGRAGVSRQWLAGFESGRMANPRWASIVSVLDELGLSLTTVRVDRGTTSAEPTVAGVAPTTKDERALDDDGVLASVLTRTKVAARPENADLGQATRDVSRYLESLLAVSPAMKAALDATSSLELIGERSSAVKAAQDQARQVAALLNTPVVQAIVEAARRTEPR